MSSDNPVFKMVKEMQEDPDFPQDKKERVKDIVDSFNEEQMIVAQIGTEVLNAFDEAMKKYAKPDTKVKGLYVDVFSNITSSVICGLSDAIKEKTGVEIMARLMLVSMVEEVCEKIKQNCLVIHPTTKEGKSLDQDSSIFKEVMDVVKEGPGPLPPPAKPTTIEDIYK